MPPKKTTETEWKTREDASKGDNPRVGKICFQFFDDDEQYGCGEQIGFCVGE